MWEAGGCGIFHQFQIPLAVPRLVRSKSATARVFFNQLAQRIELRPIQAVKLSLRQHDLLRVQPHMRILPRSEIPGCHATGESNSLRL